MRIETSINVILTISINPLRHLYLGWSSSMQCMSQNLQKGNIAHESIEHVIELFTYHHEGSLVLSELF